MEKWIKSISGVIPHTNKKIEIDLDGKNLIVTGVNGSGKTSMIKSIYDKIVLCTLNKEWLGVKDNERQVELWKSYLNDHSIGPEQKANAEREIQQFESQIDTIKNGITLNIPDADNLAALHKEKKAIISFFEEKRLSQIASARYVTGLSAEEDAAKQQNPQFKFGNSLEQHLVNLINRQSLAITKDKDNALAEKIDVWFSDFKKNLRLLFEDENLVFDYDTNNFKFFIKQNDKPPFTFQTLSAGYRAIFDVYAELLMRTEYFKIMPKELTGVVFIDEIDSHLHISLQRLIMPFFSNSFPNIQFIVTTHSPFVLMSSPDTVIFDLAQNEPIKADLSYFTYSAVMKGLWEIKPISFSLEQKINEISRIINSQNKDYKRLTELVNSVKSHSDALDSESSAFLQLAFEALEENGEDV